MKKGSVLERKHMWFFFFKVGPFVFLNTKLVKDFIGIVSQFLYRSKLIRPNVSTQK